MSMYKKVNEFQSAYASVIRVVTAEAMTLYDSQRIKRQLMKLKGILNVEIHSNKKSIHIKYYPNTIDSTSIIHAILSSGYKLNFGSKKNKPKIDAKGKSG